MDVHNLCAVFAQTLMHVESDEERINIGNMNVEYKIIDACITYHEWLFGLDEKSGKELDIQEGRRKIEAAQQAQQANRSHSAQEVRKSSAFIYEVIAEHDNQPFNIPITMESTAEEVVQEVIDKGHYLPSPEWCLVELIEGNTMWRILGSKESVFKSSSRWRGPGELRLRKDPKLSLLGPEAISAVRSGWVHYKTVDVGSEIERTLSLLNLIHTLNFVQLFEAAVFMSLYVCHPMC
eukprot:TRINITY_DN12114_c0_g1_i2.p1 TRINITY_DN12114_c0_g1~~TRINITY_DN12114_c0_g1_i2.p1  ORF type:complete len:247 (+),score=54.35 TRINITY_DN12114_c0_g1_i2:35-742(+)